MSSRSSPRQRISRPVGSHYADPDLGERAQAIRPYHAGFGTLMRPPTITRQTNATARHDPRHNLLLFGLGALRSGRLRKTLRGISLRQSAHWVLRLCGGGRGLDSPGVHHWFAGVLCLLSPQRDLT